MFVHASAIKSAGCAGPVGEVPPQPWPPVPDSYISFSRAGVRAGAGCWAMRRGNTWDLEGLWKWGWWSTDI
jgi:hypothetical protein